MLKLPLTQKKILKQEGKTPIKIIGKHHLKMFLFGMIGNNEVDLNYCISGGSYSVVVPVRWATI